jgi:hypothetical protein
MGHAVHCTLVAKLSLKWIDPLAFSLCEIACPEEESNPAVIEMRTITRPELEHIVTFSEGSLNLVSMPTETPNSLTR